METVSSTNDVAILKAKSGAAEGLVVTARNQSSGKGRREKVWWDEPDKSVLMSIVLRPDQSAMDLGRLSLTVSLGVVEALRSYCGVNALIKWPNDMIADDRKLAGILLEVNSDAHPAVIAGIGINVYQSQLPEDFSVKATSVILAGGTCECLKELQNTIVESVFGRYEQLLAKGFKDIRDDWSKYLWGLGAQASVISGNQTIKGEITGIDENGALLLAQATGGIQTIYSSDAMDLRLCR